MSGNNEKNLQFACLNARSINNKSTAMVDMFNELALSFCIVTETWLATNKNTDLRISDLEHGQNISLVRKDRTAKRGGGVAIACNNTKVKAKEVEIVHAKREHEVVAAICKDISTGSTSTSWPYIYLLP